MKKRITIETKTFIKKIFIVVFFCFFSFDFFASSKNEFNFVEKNLKYFYSEKLNNSIPVYFKEMPNAKTMQISVVFDGGISALEADEVGLEYSVFALMKTASQKYSRDYIQNASYKTKMQIDTVVKKDYSIYSLFCLNKYFEDNFNVFIDTILNPAFNERDYDLFFTELQQSSQSFYSNPSQLLTNGIFDSVFSSHPYQIKTIPNNEEIFNVTLDKIKKHYKKILDSSRIKIVVVGNFNKEKLLAHFNNSLGKIESKNFIAKKIKNPIIKSGVTLISSKMIEDSGLLVKITKAPSINDSDYIAHKLAALIYDNLLFSVVREKYGCCYTPHASAINNKKSITSTFFYSVSNFDDMLKAIEETEEIMKNKKVVAEKDSSGFKIEDLSQELEGYKNKLINTIYSATRTPIQVAYQMVDELNYSDVPYSYLYYEEKIRNTSVEEITNAFIKYWIDSPCHWVLVSDDNSFKTRAKKFIDSVK